MMDESIDHTLGYSTKEALVKLKKDIETVIIDYKKKHLFRYLHFYFNIF